MAQVVQGRARIYKITQEVSNDKCSDECMCGQSRNLGAVRLKIRCCLECWQGYRNVCEGKGLRSGLKSGFSTVTVPLLMMC
jgi:hypothetical protein